MNQNLTDKKKKIIRISTVSSSLNTFLRGQLAMLSKEYEVLAVSSPTKELDELAEREGVRTVAVPMERHISLLKDFVSLVRLIRLFAKEKPDMVHSMTPKAGLLAMVAAWLTRVPVRIHTFTGLVFPTTYGLMQKLLMLMDSVTCACATYINPEGEGVKRDLQYYGITKKSLHVIANGNVRGVNLRYYDRTLEVIERAKKWRNDTVFTFCFVGRIVKDKGINELVAAFIRLHNVCPSTRLLLVGAFEEKLDPLLPETVRVIQDSSFIITTGRQNDIRPLLASSDALVFPSYREGFPNVVLEAGAMGMASIVTDINGSNEIIRHGQNGVIIPPKDEQALYEAMLYFVEHLEEVKMMAAQARSIIAERYEQQMIWKALLKEYHNLLE